jgi:hypothetical protein
LTFPLSLDRTAFVLVVSLSSVPFQEVLNYKVLAALFAQEFRS